MAPLRSRLEALLQRHWWCRRPTLLMQALRPLSWLLAGLARLLRKAPQTVPVPVVVVGNLIVGGAGKTPTALALLRALQAAGWRPGVISRGHGRRGDGVQEVRSDSTAAEVGDEPLLIHRRSGVPVWVGRQRVAVARALCAAHPAVDVLVSDDGLQHGALPRRVELIVFDERGAGNGLRLPAGPLREAMPAVLSPHQCLLYNAAAPTTALPGALARRRLGPAVALADWRAGRGGQPLATLRGRPLLAVAGIAAPQRFFSMLDAEGLTLQRLPLPDHHDYSTLPWPAGTTDVVTTEKDAVKLVQQHLGETRVWVVGLDFELPASLTQDVLRRLGQPPQR